MTTEFVVQASAHYARSVRCDMIQAVRAQHTRSTAMRGKAPALLGLDWRFRNWAVSGMGSAASASYRHVGIWCHALRHTMLRGHEGHTSGKGAMFRRLCVFLRKARCFFGLPSGWDCIPSALVLALLCVSGGNTGMLPGCIDRLTGTFVGLTGQGASYTAWKGVKLISYTLVSPEALEIDKALPPPKQSCGVALASFSGCARLVLPHACIVGSTAFTTAEASRIEIGVWKGIFMFVFVWLTVFVADSPPAAEDSHSELVFRRTPSEYHSSCTGWRV